MQLSSVARHACVGQELGIADPGEVFRDTYLSRLIEDLLRLSDMLSHRVIELADVIGHLVRIAHHSKDVVGYICSHSVDHSAEDPIRPELAERR
jgi:hypothetical protein